MRETCELRLRLLRNGSANTLIVAAWLLAISTSQAWDQLDRITGSNSSPGSGFGNSVALHDGLALVGADDDQEFGMGAGAAYLFASSSGTWGQITELTSSDSAANQKFGSAVGLNQGTALVGAIGDTSFTGAVYVFEESASWNEVDKLVAADTSAGDWFGAAASLRGSVALFGAPFGDKDELIDVGAAYVFSDSGGNGWQQTAKLTANDAAADERDQFGAAVALDGDWALVGAWLDDDRGSNAGAAYLYSRDGLSNWNQVAKLTASDAKEDHLFGSSVAISGNTLLVGAPSADSVTYPGVGAAYVFQEDDLGVWHETAKLTADDVAAGEFDQFGYSVALDGDTAIVGAVFDRDGGFGAGSAYVFKRAENSQWVQVDKLLADDRAALDNLGEAVALEGNLALIGALGSGGTGAAYLFGQQPPFQGADFDENGFVNDADLAAWQSGYGLLRTATHIDGDANADGTVDGRDFLIWQSQHRGASSSRAIAPLPEPGALTISSVALLILMRKLSPSERSLETSAGWF